MTRRKTKDNRHKTKDKSGRERRGRRDDLNVGGSNALAYFASRHTSFVFLFCLSS
jgi:hypothetical protein